MALETSRVDLPSLHALRAFEAAARLGSFARAAEELLTTASGVAQHVKTVEAWADQPLFERSARGVRLNEAGAAALPDLSAGFAAIGNACTTLRQPREHTASLRIAALPALAQLWVVPRLAAINHLYPGVDISVHAVDTPPDLDHEPFDATIYYAPVVDGVGSDEITPVAAPHIAQQIVSPQDLEDHNLVYDRTWRSHWSSWLTAAHVDHRAATTGASFTLYAMAIEAARNGDGVLLGRRSLVARYLHDGSLVAPFDLWVPTGDTVQITLSASTEPGLHELLVP